MIGYNGMQRAIALSFLTVWWNAGKKEEKEGRELETDVEDDFLLTLKQSPRKYLYPDLVQK